MAHFWIKIMYFYYNKHFEVNNMKNYYLHLSHFYFYMNCVLNYKKMSKRININRCKFDLQMSSYFICLQFITWITLLELFFEWNFYQFIYIHFS